MNYSKIYQDEGRIHKKEPMSGWLVWFDGLIGPFGHLSGISLLWENQHDLGTRLKQARGTTFGLGWYLVWSMNQNKYREQDRRVRTIKYDLGHVHGSRRANCGSGPNRTRLRSQYVAAAHPAGSVVMQMVRCRPAAPQNASKLVTIRFTCRGGYMPVWGFERASGLDFVIRNAIHDINVFLWVFWHYIYAEVGWPQNVRAAWGTCTGHVSGMGVGDREKSGPSALSRAILRLRASHSVVRYTHRGRAYRSGPQVDVDTYHGGAGVQNWDLKYDSIWITEAHI
ncbi:hypothetical protein B0H17DRAFT_1134576 [Mycena rosella]|uniref:Uncharacterized protein n=1 Tax=Mycena rosella TaxID=1033263 RepID=A0AAD7GE14_MYCRO|nr:hypothetical protein B0H17DRAFT_1134576 [Mycena rosella]